MKTIYGLTEHKGVWYLKTSILLFGISSLFELLLRVSGPFFGPSPFEQNFYLGPLLFIVGGFINLLAVVYLILSSLHKYIKNERIKKVIPFLIFFLFLISSFMISPKNMEIVTYAQIVLIVLGLTSGIYLMKSSEKKVGKFGIWGIYILLFLFWVMDSFPFNCLRPNEFFPPEFMILPKIFQVIIFLIIFNKTRRWLK